MSRPEWFAVLVVALLAGTVAGVKLVADRLDRIIALLERRAGDR